ncbi:MAG TPA: hypothetical protein VK169_13585 [Saprospiraceae bacterium]|nr:hypothetical protein [Saprospiraceae bacterium]
MKENRPVKLLLKYNRNDFEKIFFGESVWKTYLDDGRKDSLIVFAVFSALLGLFLVVWKLVGTFYWIIIPLVLYWLFQGILLFLGTLEFRKWYQAILRISKNEEEYQNSELQLCENWLILKTKNNEYRYNYDSLKYVEINEQNVKVYFQTGEPLFFPKSSFNLKDFDIFIKELNKHTTDNLN